MDMYKVRYKKGLYFIIWKKSKFKKMTYLKW